MYISMMVDVNLGEISSDNLIEELEDRGFTVDGEEFENTSAGFDEAQRIWALIRNGSSWEAAAREFIFTLANKVV